MALIMPQRDDIEPPSIMAIKKLPDPIELTRVPAVSPFEDIMSAYCASTICGGITFSIGFSSRILGSRLSRVSAEMNTEGSFTAKVILSFVRADTAPGLSNTV